MSLPDATGFWGFVDLGEEKIICWSVTFDIFNCADVSWLLAICFTKESWNKPPTFIFNHGNYSQLLHVVLYSLCVTQFISKKNRIAVYSYLFKGESLVWTFFVDLITLNSEGTIVAKKDFILQQHSEDVPIPNIEVLSLMKSFVSRGFVKHTFNWQWNYYYLTNTGIEYLRQFLALPADIVPATLKPLPARAGREGGEGGKDKGFSGDANPEFAGEGGFGRGRRNQDGYR